MFHRREIAERLTRAKLIANVEPLFRFRSDLVKSFKGIRVQDRFSTAAIESLNETVSHRLAGLDELWFDPVCLLPDRRPPKLSVRSVIEFNACGKAAPAGDLNEETNGSVS